MTAEIKNRNPYPGPRPFEREEQRLFFGREREVRELRSLITAHRAVLLYAQSGAGKTSVLNAGLIPLLMEQGFEVLPVARVRGFEPEDIDLKEIPNIYVFNTLVGWAGDNAEPGSLVSTSIVTFLEAREHLTDEQGLPSPRVAIFDQFEELFTSYPGRWKEREDFFSQVVEALEADPLLRVLFVIREDYLASLDSYIDFLPERLRTRCRLERLRADAACQAVERPIRDTGRTFAEGVASRLVNKLLNIRVENAAGEIVETPGEYVEPVQLQVVCQSLWLNLPREVTVITSDHLQEFGDVHEALRSFYERTVDIAKRQTGVNESDLRGWFNDKLITPAGTRGTVFQGKEQTEGIANSAVDVLEAQHIIRAEMRAGARWYELTHDRLIEPIRKSNEERQRAEEQRRARRLRRLAAALIAICIVTFTLIFFKYFKTYSLDTPPPAVGGSVKKYPDKCRYNHGETVTLEAEPNTGYSFNNWSDDLSGDTNPATLVMDADKLVTAHFLKNYSLTILAIDGSVTKDPNNDIYKDGETVTLEADPNMGYSFTNWSDDLSGDTNPATLVMNTDKLVTANFYKTDPNKSYRLTATAVNGSVTKDPNKVSYKDDETVTLEAVPKTGYSFMNWSGNLSGSTNPATLVMDGDKSVTASFASSRKASTVTPPGFYIHRGCVEFRDQENVISKGPITRVKVYYSGYIHGLQLYYGGYGGLVFGFQDFKDTDVKLDVGEFVVPAGQRIVRVEGEISKNASGFLYVSRLQFITDSEKAPQWFGGRQGQGTPFTAADKNNLPLRTISGWVNLRRHPSLNRAITSMTFHFGY
jgi:hypothetical protein